MPKPWVATGTALSAGRMVDALELFAWLAPTAVLLAHMAAGFHLATRG